MSYLHTLNEISLSKQIFGFFENTSIDLMIV